MSWLRFIFSKKFYKHVAFATVVILGGLFAVMQLLRVYTHHDNTIILSDFSGMQIEVADSLIAEQKLRYVIIDSVYNRNKPPGSVIDQDPKAGVHVKENRRIYLSIVAKNEQMLKMPKLIDLTHRSAIYKLKGMGFTLGNLSYVPNMAKNAVLKQNVKGQEAEIGKEYPIGTTIDLVLGNGLSDVKVELPLLEGLTLEDAGLVLQMSSLNIGLTVFDSDVQDSSRAVVYRQRPEARNGRMINLGRPVDVYLKVAADKSNLNQ